MKGLQPAEVNMHPKCKSVLCVITVPIVQEDILCGVIDNTALRSMPSTAICYWIFFSLFLLKTLWSHKVMKAATPLSRNGSDSHYRINIIGFLFCTKCCVHVLSMLLERTQFLLSRSIPTDIMQGHLREKASPLLLKRYQLQGSLSLYSLF